MKWSWNTTACLCVLISGLGVVLAFTNLQEHRRILMDTIHRRDTLVQNINEYETLSLSQQDTILGTKPQQDIEARIAEAIAVAKISPRPRFRATVQADREVSNRGSSSSGAIGLREQIVSIHIPGLSVEEIGRLLIYWHDQQQIWSPTHIELIHDQRSNTNKYSLQLDCKAVYHADGA